MNSYVTNPHKKHTDGANLEDRCKEMANLHIMHITSHGGEKSCKKASRIILMPPYEGQILCDDRLDIFCANFF